MPPLGLQQSTMGAETPMGPSQNPNHQFSGERRRQATVVAPGQHGEPAVEQATQEPGSTGTQSDGMPNQAGTGANPNCIDETDLLERQESWPTFLSLDKSKLATRKWSQAHRTGNFHPLPKHRMNVADKLSTLKSMTTAMSQQPAFLLVCGVDVKAPDFNLQRAVSEFTMSQIPHSIVALVISEAFEGGNNFNGDSFFANKKAKNSACQFMVNLAMTSHNHSVRFNPTASGWKRPCFSDALHHALSEYFGPVALCFNTPMSKTPAVATKKPHLVKKKPYIIKKEMATQADPALTVETAKTLTPNLSHLALENVPPPQGELVETFFNILTPRLTPTTTTTEKTDVLSPVVIQLLTKLFTIDPHAQVKRYPGSEDMSNVYTIMGTVR